MAAAAIGWSRIPVQVKPDAPDFPGLTEAINLQEEEFGQARLAELVRDGVHGSAQELIGAVRGRLPAFTLTRCCSRLAPRERLNATARRPDPTTVVEID